jgi:formate-dependent nitrite reductase membrane component NrfD
VSARVRELKMVPRAEPRSYYGRPVIKSPVWKPEVPWYFFTGGLSGASSTFALAAGWAGSDLLARRSWTVAMLTGVVNPVLLISDLGRPERFLNMLRMFKVTSPMSVGSWVVSVSGSANGVATMSRVLGVAPRLGAVARLAAGASGLPMATYTAVLIANTSVPVWREARRELPFVFAGSAAASAGAAAAIATPRTAAAPARRLALLGSALEQGAAIAMERRLGELAAPYRDGDAARYAQLARALTLAGAALIGLGGRRSRVAAAVGGTAVLAGSVAARWGVFEAGKHSARDPRFTVGPQRARLEERDGGH